jgi:hypothetical protein
LWEGVEAYDYDQKQKFNLRVAYIWSIHDFRAYSIFLEWSYNGLLICPICMKGTSCFLLKFGGKIYYFDCHRFFLPLDHSFRLDNDSFKKGNFVLEGPPKRLSGPEITDMLDNLVLKETGDVFTGYGNEHKCFVVLGFRIRKT